MNIMKHGGNGQGWGQSRNLIGCNERCTGWRIHDPLVQKGGEY